MEEKLIKKKKTSLRIRSSLQCQPFFVVVVVVMKVFGEQVMVVVVGREVMVVSGSGCSDR